MPVDPPPQPTLQLHRRRIIQSQSLGHVKEPLVRRKGLERHGDGHGLGDADLEPLALLVLVLRQGPDLLAKAQIEPLLELGQVVHLESNVVRGAAPRAVDRAPVGTEVGAKEAPGDGVQGAGADVVDRWASEGAVGSGSGEEDNF